MTNKLRVLDEQPERVETGALQFGKDWPGVFIRGDNAGYYAMLLKSFLEKDESDDNFIERHTLIGLVNLLESSNAMLHSQEQK